MRSRHRSRPRPLVAALAALGVLLAACAGDDAGSDAPTTTAPPEVTETAAPPADPTPTTPSTPSPAPTQTAESEGVDLTASCVLEPAGGQGLPAVGLEHPEGWDVGADEGSPCEFFDPEDPDLPEESEVFSVDVRWSVDPVDFATAAEPGPSLDESSRLPTVVDERQAVRLTGTTTGDGLLPTGVERTTWIVDLGVGGGQGILVGTAHDVETVDYERAVDVLDAMARSVDVDPGEDVGVPFVTVARATGGGAPYTVTYDRSTTCMTLYAGDLQGPVLDETCAVGGAEPVTAHVLGGDDREVVAGLGTDPVEVVRLRANTDAARAVATVPVGGGLRGYALLLSGTEATVVAETFDGEELGTAEVPL